MNLLRHLIVCFSLWLTATGAFAAEITTGPEVEVKGLTAVVRWTTDVTCGTVLKYGTNPNNLNHREEGALGQKHEVLLNGLTDGQTYFFTAGTSKKALKNGQFTVGKPAKAEPVPRAAPKPAPPPVQKAAPEPAKPAPREAPPAKATWGDLSSLRDHFNRHGRDFGSTSPEHYARQAWEFLQRAMAEGLPAKVDEDGVIRVYEAKTKSFAAYNRDGTTKTFFKPQRPDYFRDQPGKIIRLKRPDPAQN